MPLSILHIQAAIHVLTTLGLHVSTLRKFVFNFTQRINAMVLV